eukprot:TRINITY_DN1400_c0_g1_i1.p1 TRINITY_DN1400_c0_g1~~TRINITY_DN1400_c0_g1_i1.p1  ORF type:complete len:433 (+),score=64.43 TRINITY_DN1400_c0_g1_i1:60-1358(+)
MAQPSPGKNVGSWPASSIIPPSAPLMNSSVPVASAQVAAPRAGSAVVRQINPIAPVTIAGPQAISSVPVITSLAKVPPPVITSPTNFSPPVITSPTNFSPPVITSPTNFSPNARSLNVSLGAAAAPRRLAGQSSATNLLVGSVRSTGSPLSSPVPLAGTPVAMVPIGAAPPAVSTAIGAARPLQAPENAARPLQVPRPETAAFVPPTAEAATSVETNKFQGSGFRDLRSIAELQRASKLAEINVCEACGAFQVAAIGGKLTCHAFGDVLVQLLGRHGIMDFPDQSIQDAVFDVFDRDKSGKVDMMELLSGVSLFCKGTETDKIDAWFGMFDENGDGYVSMDEMFKFFHSIFKIGCTPEVMSAVNGMGVTVEDAEALASVTALEVFQQADLSRDGRVSKDEFRTWFQSEMHDPAFMFSPLRCPTMHETVPVTG